MILLRKEVVCSLLYIFIVVPTFWCGMSGDSTISNEVARNIIIYNGYVGIFIMFIFAIYKNIVVLSKNNILGCCVVIVFWILYYFDSYVVVNPDILNILFLNFFLLLKNEVKAIIYCYFKNVLLVSSFMGIIFYIVTVWGMDIGQTVAPYYSVHSEGKAFYIVWGPLNIFLEGFYLRLCGFFNEPGFLGTVLAIVLTIEKYNLNKKNMVFMLAGVLSWSLAFFAISLINILYRQYNNIKNLILVAIVVSFIGGVVFVNNPNIEHIWYRLSIDSNWNFVGDNRSNKDIDEGFADTLTSEYILLGHGTGYSRTISSESFASYKTLFIEHGILGTIVTYGGILALVVKISKRQKNCIWLIFIYFVSLYQRPVLFLSVYFILLFGGIQYILKQQKI